mmetsp:Transcript_63576/g.153520  ORF Transcript_63576/g.153520 Transcript_63576/m.153520 type:complete len:204 (-) Transcript_63576:142-753(-)
MGARALPPRDAACRHNALPKPARGRAAPPDDHLPLSAHERAPLPRHLDLHQQDGRVPARQLHPQVQGRAVPLCWHHAGGPDRHEALLLLLQERRRPRGGARHHTPTSGHVCHGCAWPRQVAPAHPRAYPDRAPLLCRLPPLLQGWVRRHRGDQGPRAGAHRRSRRRPGRRRGQEGPQGEGEGSARPGHRRAGRPPRDLAWRGA